MHDEPIQLRRRVHRLLGHVATAHDACGKVCLEVASLGRAAYERADEHEADIVARVPSYKVRTTRVTVRRRGGAALVMLGLFGSVASGQPTSSLSGVVRDSVRHVALSGAVVSTLTIAAVTIAAALVQQSFFPRHEDLAGRIISGPPKFVASWHDVVRNGVVMGDSAAPIKIIEFADLECPFCKRFQETTHHEIRSRYGDRVALVFVHYPLEMHRFAAISARAAECASAQGRFPEFVDLVYAKQDSLGLKSWGSYAHEAGVSDTAALLSCVGQHNDITRIDSGRAMAARLGIVGTPGVMVNGWLFPQPAVGYPSQSDGSIAIARESSL